jgi:hypothetical protein
MAVADGYLVGFNGYDNQIYCFGKGQSGTSVTASPGVGNAVTIQGTVTDQSPGKTSLGIPAAGTPAISDAFMSDWMAYLYEQQTKPNGATGVTVRLTAIDSTGKATDLGTTTSDVTGNYAVSWIPSTSGLYTITASFDGSGSYFASSAETHITVASTTAANTNSASSLPPEAFYAVSAVIVILILAVAVLLLRKK